MDQIWASQGRLLAEGFHEACPGLLSVGAESLRQSLEVGHRLSVVKEGIPSDHMHPSVSRKLQQRWAQGAQGQHGTVPVPVTPFLPSSPSMSLLIEAKATCRWMGKLAALSLFLWQRGTLVVPATWKEVGDWILKQIHSVILSNKHF